jgi:hypothetical protein
VSTTSERIPDPAALAQGHRLIRAMRGLRMPAWVFGLFALFMVGAEALEDQTVAVGLGLLSMLAIGSLLASPRPVVPGPGAQANSRLPSELHEVLGLIDGLIDRLEHGHDRAFGLDAVELGIALDALGPSACRYLEERGTDPARLRHGVCTPAELATNLSVEHRRALHRELCRFVAAARGRPCGDPYRSRVVGMASLLDALAGPTLARTRRRYGLVLAAFGVAWIGAWLGIAAWVNGMPEGLCSALHDPRCFVNLGDLAFASMIALALVPTFSLGVALVTRVAAWRSWAAALPEQELDEPHGGSSNFVVMRQWLLRRARMQRRLRLASLILAAGCVVGYFEPQWHEFELGDVVLAVGLLALSLVVSSALAMALGHRAELRAFGRRLARSQPERREMLTELFAARSELADATPPRTEQFEQLAELLTGVEQLDGLEAGDRDRVVRRLRMAARRGSALRRDQRDDLVLDVWACESLLVGARGK